MATNGCNPIQTILVAKSTAEWQGIYKTTQYHSNQARNISCERYKNSTVSDAPALHKLIKDQEEKKLEQ